ncbi:MAG TPA: hypothetical protein VF474_10475 [Phenylobacterium sp.]
MAIADEIYEALADDQAFAALPSRIAAQVGGRSCALMTYAPDGALQSLTFNYFTPEMIDFYWATQMYRHDPWYQAAAQPRALNRAAAMGEAVTPDAYLKSKFYNGFIRPFGDDTFHCVAGMVTFAGGSGGLGLHRAMGDRVFTEGDGARVQALIPHLRLLFQVRTALAKAEQRLQLAEAAMNAQQQAVFVTDETGRPLQMNRRAETLARAGAGVRLTRQGLRASDPATDARLADAISEAGKGTRRGAALTLPRPSGGPPLRAVVAPLTISERTRVLVLVDDPADHDEDLSDKLARVYGLTVAEAATVAALVADRTPQEAAAQRGVSLPTVRTQIQQALAKTGARGLSELVRLAASLPRIARDPEG